MPNDFFIKKLTFIQIFEIALNVYRKYFRYILLAGLLIVLPFNFILILIPLPTAIELQNYLLSFASPTGVLNLPNSPEFNKMLAYCCSVFVLTIVYNPLSKAICAYLTKSHIHGKTPEFIGFVDSSIGRWGKHIATSALFNVFIMICVFLFITLSLSAIGVIFNFIVLFPAISYGVGASFYTVITATSDKWGFGALKESYRIIKRQLLSAVGFLINISIMSYLFSSVFSLVFDSLVSIISGGADSNGSFMTVLYFIGGVMADTLRLFFQVLSAVWFLNRLNTVPKIDISKVE